MFGLLQLAFDAMVVVVRYSCHCVLYYWSSMFVVFQILMPTIKLQISMCTLCDVCYTQSPTCYNLYIPSIWDGGQACNLQIVKKVLAFGVFQSNNCKGKFSKLLHLHYGFIIHLVKLNVITFKWMLNIQLSIKFRV